MVMLQMLNLLNIKKKIVGKTLARPGDAGDADRPAVPISNVEVTIPLKYLGKFWIFFYLPLINCEIELDLSWTKDCVLIEHNRGKLTYNNITGLNFMITSTKRYVPIVISIFFENIKQGFKRTISWNKYRSETTTQTENDNLDYLTDSTFRNINKLFVLSFKNDNDDLRETLLINITCH